MFYNNNIIIVFCLKYKLHQIYNFKIYVNNSFNTYNFFFDFKYIFQLMFYIY